MLTFTQNNSGESLKLLTWDKVDMDGVEKEKYPIKNVTIEIEAGEEAKMIVERYLDVKYKDGGHIRTINEKGKSKPLTFKEKYFIMDCDVDLKIRRYEGEVIRGTGEKNK